VRFSCQSPLWRRLGALARISRAPAAGVEKIIFGYTNGAGLHRHPRRGPHYAACKGVGPAARRGAGLARSRPLWTSGRSFARLKQVSANLSHRALASGKPHCSAIATHAARRRRYSSECMLPSRHANIHPQCITSMRYRQRNMPLDRVTPFFPFFLVLSGCSK
jgi:hypothetical protein